MPAIEFGQRATILVVEPDETTLQRIIEVLLNERFRPVAARTGSEAISRLAHAVPNLVLMEWNLPDMSGLGLCRYIRAQSPVPLLVASGTDSEADMVAGLEAGADGYLAKPLRWRELTARIRAALRRSPQAGPRRDGKVFVVGDVTVDADRHEVWVGSRAVELPLREFQVLEALVASPGKVWAREALMRRLWGETPESGTKSLGVHVSRLRARIEDDPARPTRILTVRGAGYTFAPTGVADEQGMDDR